MPRTFIARAVTLYKYFTRVEYLDGTVEFIMPKDEGEYRYIERADLMAIECHIGLPS